MAIEYSETTDSGYDVMNDVNNDLTIPGIEKVVNLKSTEMTESTTYNLSPEQIKSCNEYINGLDTNGMGEFLVNNLNPSFEKNDSECLYILDKIFAKLKLPSNLRLISPETRGQVLDGLGDKLLTGMTIDCSYSETAQDHIYYKCKPSDTKHYTKYFEKIRDFFFRLDGKTNNIATNYSRGTSNTVPTIPANNIGWYANPIDGKGGYYKQYEPKPEMNNSEYANVFKMISALNDIFRDSNLLANQNDQNPYAEKFQQEVNKAKEQFKKDNPKKFQS